MQLLTESPLETGPPIDEVINANLIPKLVLFTDMNDQPHLQVIKVSFPGNINYISLKLLGL